MENHVCYNISSWVGHNKYTDLRFMANAIIFKIKFNKNILD